MNFDLAALQNELIRDEGLKLSAYQDSLGYWTIGVGRLIDARKGGKISEREARILLGNDIVSRASELDAALPWWKGLSDGRQRAILNMAFNLGVPGLLGFRGMLAAMQAGDWEAASREALNSKWATQVGQRANRVAVLILEG
jgi:lysozyme